MANAKRDQNRVTAALGISDADGITPMPLLVDPVTGALLCKVADDTTSGAFTSRPIAKRDQNGTPVAMGVAADTQQPRCLITHNGYLAVQAD